jgi:dTDP-4-dehydrorhamnose 3,5-epimerase
LSTLRFAPSRRPYVAHGFQRLANKTEVICRSTVLTSQPVSRGSAGDDPEFGRAWPLPVTVMFGKDANLPSFVTVVS